MGRNYHKELKDFTKLLEGEGKTPSLLLHSCCAPCSTRCIEYLSDFFYVTAFYYNPNIYPAEEYYFRKDEQKRFIEEFPAKYKVSFVEGDYEVDRFYEVAKGLEKEPERGARCSECFKLRLGKTAQKAKEIGTEYFATTLTLSPLKNAEVLNKIGKSMGETYGSVYLPTDFKKENGFLRSCELSSQYGMYRQDYCGCEFSISRLTCEGPT